MTDRSEQGASAARDRGEGVAWAAVGAIILALSIGMDRLAEQGVSTFAAPGLLPGMLGLLMIVSGLVLAFRSGKLVENEHAASARPKSVRTWIVIGLCLTFSFGLIGRGLPFWVAAALFVSVSILVLDPASENSGATSRWPSLRRIGFAIVVALAAGLIATLIFQQIFLVRLP
jgi:putative tricarboxylic transport membrane protein